MRLLPFVAILIFAAACSEGGQAESGAPSESPGSSLPVASEPEPTKAADPTAEPSPTPEPTAAPPESGLEVLQVAWWAWPAEREGTAVSQVVIEVRNVTDGWLNLGAIYTEETSTVVFVDVAGEPLEGYSERSLSAAPIHLAPGETAYYLANGDIREPAENVADVRFELFTAPGEPPHWTGTTSNVRVEAIEQGLAVRGDADWDGDGRAVTSAVAFDPEGKLLGGVRSIPVSRSGQARSRCAVFRP